MSKEKNNTKVGYIFTIQAYLLWAVLPIFWKMLKHVPSEEVLAHRIFWAFVIIIILLWYSKKLKIKSVLNNRKLMKSLVVTSLLIGINWGLFVYAVNSDRILEASFGYFINPLVSVLLGMLILKERLSILKIIALVIAVAGVVYMTLDFGKLPWISLSLAFAFGFYGLLKKITPIGSLQGLAIESMLLSPFSLAYIIYKMINGTGHLFIVTIQSDVMLIFAGLFTVLPLFWFAKGAKRIPLSSVGFLQYLAPSIMLFIGVFMYNEEFGETRIISFSLIWVALLIYTYSMLIGRKKKPTVSTES